MSDHNQQDKTNNKTSAPGPLEAGFAASRRLDHDRNSDKAKGETTPLTMSHNGYDRNNLFRSPQAFREGSGASGWDGRGVPSGRASYRPASAGGIGNRGDFYIDGRRITPEQQAVLEAANAALNGGRDPRYTHGRGIILAVAISVGLLVGLGLAWALFGGAR